jgi:hypothetical protein
MVSRPFSTRHVLIERAQNVHCLLKPCISPGLSAARRITCTPKMTSIADESLGPPVISVRWRKIP